MGYSKRISIFAGIRQNDKKTGRVSASFPLCKSLTPLCLADQTAQGEQDNHKIHFFLAC